MSYKIGYKRPPATNQFKKGQSGNPKGRPKGSRNFLTLLDKELNQSITVNENGRKKKITRLQAIAKRVVAEALQGNPRGLINLITIFRQTGQFEAMDKDTLLPENYESLLDNFMTNHRHSKKDINGGNQND